jgi:hypothetical protein
MAGGFEVVFGRENHEMVDDSLKDIKDNKDETRGSGLH